MGDRVFVRNVDELRTLLSQHPDVLDLVGASRRIPEVVEKVWETNFQPWFTDHGPNHSRRVAQYAFDLTQLPNMSPSLRLSPLEYFILWASAWLHDVGMQDLAWAGNLGDLTAEGYKAVRHEHPERSSHRILSDWAALGLPESDHVLAELIAAVARAHGTSFYRQTVDERLPATAMVRNQAVRPRLLAALLLFADELDLHYQRTENLPGWAVNNVISQAHAFKHKSVRSVSTLGHGDGSISVTIELDVPASLGPSDATTLARWIQMKLRRQMGMIEQEVMEGFAHQARFDRNVRITTRTSLANVPLPDPLALKFIKAEVERDELINHAVEFGTARDALAEGRAVVVSPTQVGTPFSGEPPTDARLDLIAALCAWGEASGRTVAESRRLSLTLGGVASDVLNDWCSQLGIAAVAPCADEIDERAAALARLDAFLSVGQNGSSFILVLERSELLEDEAAAWLVAEAVAALAEEHSVVVVLGGLPEHLRFRLDDPHVVHLETPSVQHLEEFLGAYAQEPFAGAEALSCESYSAAKSLAQNHELTFQGDAR